MFRIVTDTSSNLPTAYLQAENITVIPFTFHTAVSYTHLTLPTTPYV